MKIYGLEIDLKDAPNCVRYKDYQLQLEGSSWYVTSPRGKTWPVVYDSLANAVAAVRSVVT